MAYPTIDAPYGLAPVKLLSGVPLSVLLGNTLLLVLMELVFFMGMQ